VNCSPFLLAISLFLATPNVAATIDTDSANALRQECRAFIDVKGNFEAGVCAGTVSTARALVGVSSARFGISVPEKATDGELAEVFLKYVDDHPEKLHENGISMLILSWRAVFPYLEPLHGRAHR